MKTKLHVIFLLFFCFCLLNSITLYAQTYSITGAGTNDVNGVYIDKGLNTDNTHEYYQKISGTSASMYIYNIGSAWEIYSPLNDPGVPYYIWDGGDSPTIPLGGSSNGSTEPYWNPVSGGSPFPVSSQNTTANMTFTNGSSFSPTSGVPGTNDNVIGRFYLKGDAVGGVLQAVTINLTGTRSGISYVKLYSSTDNSFGSDQLLSLKSDGSSVTFDNFNSLVDNSSGTYYFVTVDLSAGATGSVTATIPSQASFTFISGSANAPSSFSNAPLSSVAVSLPVELNSFTAAKNGDFIELQWSTATEINNYGFEIQRLKVSASSSTLSGWEKVGFVKGYGNSNSPKDYLFTDNSNLKSGKYSYRLKQIDNNGEYKYSKVVEVNFGFPAEYSLNQNYPNPFNPTTTIKYQIAKAGFVTLKVYNILGRKVATLVNEEKQAGNYSTDFNAAGLSSGIYFYRISAGNFVSTKKMILMK